MDSLKLFELCTNRHWCPQSETFTGADSLLTAVDEGWVIHQDILLRTYNLRSSCVTTVYSFYLQRESNVALINVVANPFVHQLIKEKGLIVHTQDTRYKIFSQTRSSYEIVRQKDVSFA